MCFCGVGVLVVGSSVLLVLVCMMLCLSFGNGGIGGMVLEWSVVLCLVILCGLFLLMICLRNSDICVIVFMCGWCLVL